MSTCAIQYEISRISRKFTGNNYNELAKLLLSNPSEGYFYNVEETANNIKSFLESRGGNIPSFSPKKFVSVVTSMFLSSKVSSENEYFSREISELYENATESLSYMTNQLEQKLIKLAFVDPEKNTISIDNTSLNGNIQGYKNELFEKIFDFVKLNKSESYKDIEFQPLYINKRYNDKSNYNKVISDLSDIFRGMNYSTNVSIYDTAQLKTLDVFNAGVVLSNFDKLVEEKFNNIISVNQMNYGNLKNPLNNLHYFLEFKGVSTEYWKGGSHEEESADKYASNFVKVISSTIPLLDFDGKPKPNQYLGMSGIYLLGILIKKLNNTTTLNNFQDSPKDNLQKFLEELKDQEKLTYLGGVNSLYSYLYHPIKGVSNIIKRAKSENPDISSKLIDIEAVIAHQLNNTVAPTYGIYAVDEDKKLLNLVERDLQSDEVRSQMLDHIIQNKNLYSIVSFGATQTKINTDGNEFILDDIKNSPNTNQIKILSDLTGVNINSNFLKILKKTQSGKSDPENVFNKSFNELLKTANKIIKEVNESDRLDLEKLSSYLNSPAIIDIINSNIADLNPDANMTFKNTVGDLIPTVKLSNLAHEQKTVRNIAEKQFGENKKNLLFLKVPGLSKGIETFLEVKTDENKSTQAIYLNPEEHFYAEFVDNYIKPMLATEDEVSTKGNYLSFMLVNYSDKSTILNEMIDQYALINENHNLKSIPLAVLKSEYKKYTNLFYSNLIEKIVKNYENLVFSDELGNIHKFLPDLSKKQVKEQISLINTFLATNKNNLDKIVLNSWKYVEAQKKLGLLDPNFNLEITDEVTYSKYKDGLFFNKTITNYYFGSLPSAEGEFGDIAQQAELLFINKLIDGEYKIPINQLLGGEKGKTLKHSHVSNLYNSLNLDMNDWVTFSNNIPRDFVYFRYKDSSGETIPVISLDKSLKDKKLYNIELNPLLAKWLHTQNLVRYGALSLTTKHEYQHPHKIKKNYADMSAIEEMTGRSISMTKRMVIYPATMEYYQQGLRNGIPPEIKLAVVNDLSAISYNFNGILKEHDAWDGSLASNPFLSFLLKNSFPAKGISDVQKSIGTFSRDTHSTFLKCALFTFTNEMIRKSSGSTIDLDRIMKSMNNVPIDPETNLSKNSINNNLIDLDQILPEGIYYKLGNHIHKVEKLEKMLDNSYNVVTTIVNSTQQESISFNRKINNLYDLWQCFGGAYSMTKTNGEYIYSDASIEAVGNIISLVDGLKDKMIGILAQKSSVKNGATNINHSSMLSSENPEFMYSNFDTHFLGIQLDANHISDQSVVNEISQVISALAENQATPELYSELYSAIGEIINSEIKEYDKKYRTETGQFDLRKISEDFVNVLKSGKELGNALEIVNLLEKISVETLPISNNNFFKGFVINVISKLKTDFIKRKYPGIAAVLNPSYGMIQIYEDEEGNTYFADDILNLAEESDYQIENIHNLNISDVNKQILGNILSRKFANKLLSPEEFGTIKPLDRLIIESIENPGNIETVDLKNIQDYYSFKSRLQTLGDTVRIYKVNTKPRDLKPVEISFVQNNVQTNIFDNDPIRLTWAYERYLEQLKKGINPEGDDLIIIQNFISYSSQKDGFSVSNIFDPLVEGYVRSKLKLWNKRSFELLDLGLNFKKVDLSTNFNDLFGKDDFVSKLDLLNYNLNYLDKITEYKHKPAEIIMPKIYRSEFDIKNDSFNKILLQKEKYFYNKINQILDPDTKDCDLFLSNSKGENVYISALTEEELDNKIKLEDLSKLYINTKKEGLDLWRVDVKGNKLYKLPWGTKIFTNKDGLEIIVFIKDKNNKYLKSINSFVKTNRSQFVYPFLKHDFTNAKEYIKISKKYNFSEIGNLVDNKFKTLNDVSPETYFEEIKTQTSDILGKAMYSSWQKSNDVVAARIPSQAMQSFMSMKVVGYNEDPGNNVYVSHIQLWLQGSDF